MTIEACKQWYELVREDSSASSHIYLIHSLSLLLFADAIFLRGAFKSRAAKIQKAVGGKASVEINKEKPGRGNFVVKVDWGDHCRTLGNGKCCDK